ncbi:NADH-quinone oxidoreductase subunit NuoG [Buchnera aphidicola (Ceratovacuna keduensis)]|uniref:NADH-quinone oxidoreductase subunit NuoG n=1 Tax=Buchnera aphidicola TaxID=9 RepID=UPI0031B83E50
MVTILIDRKRYEVDSSKNILQNCLENNVNVPYFCWHPSLGSVGSCRQCAIKHKFIDFNGIVQTKIIMSCMSKPEKNMEIYVHEDDEVNKFRKSIVEMLMLHHPHDCPICPEGGNCHLQDITVVSNHNIRRYRYKKRIYKNQYLGRFISHEMNRCISCYKCVRFYKDYADGKDFDVYGLSNNLYFGRVKDGDLENEHSGNLIEICPTGVFTDKLHNKNYSRKIDMSHTPSICNFCSVGCNIIGSERLGIFRKVENRYHGDINGHFICDLGRFGHQFINKKNVPLYPFLLKKNKRLKLSKKQAIKEAKNILKKSKIILGIGSYRSNIENNFALLNFVGKKNFSNGMIEKESECNNIIVNFLKKNCTNIPTLKEIENYDASIIIGQDITITAPRMSLSIRQSAKNQINNKNFDFKKICNFLKISSKNKIFNKINSSIFILSNDYTKLDDISKINYYSDYENQSKFLFFLEKVISNKKIEKCDFFTSKKEKILYISEILKKCKKPLIILSFHDNNLNLIKSCINLIDSLKRINSNLGSIFLTSGPNSISTSIMSNISLEKILKKAYEEKNVSIILMENDLYRLISKNIIEKILKKDNKIIVLDHLNTDSMKSFNLSLPVNSFLESTGTIVNYEARSQRYFKILDKKQYNKLSLRMDSWKWISKIYYEINKKKFKCSSLENIINLCLNKIPDFEGIQNSSPRSNFRIIGQKIPRYPNRASGRTVLRNSKKDFKKNVIYDSETMFSMSMEGHHNFNNKISHIPFVWNPGINSSQAWNNISKKNFFSGKKLFKFIKKKNIKKNKISFYKSFNKNELIVTRYISLFSCDEISQFYKNFVKEDEFIPGFVNLKYANFLKLKKGSILLFRFNSKNFKIIIYFSKFLKYGYISLPIGSFKIPLFLNGYKIKKFKII